jgi:glycosyltransferase involved in cell wall biosynthesis
VGLFVPWHGLLFLLDVFEKLVERYESLHLVLVGDGPERAVVEQNVRARELSGKVTLTGYVAHDSVPDFVSAFDAAVMPDSNEHGSPMKIFEYMGMAIPVVAPSYAPIQEVLRDGENALLFEPRDAGGLYRALERLIKDERFRDRLGEAARRDVLAGHTWHHNAVKLQETLAGITPG